MIAKNPDIIDFIVEVCTETTEDGQTVVSIDALGNCLGYDLEDLAYEVAVDTKGALRCFDCDLYASLEATVDVLPEKALPRNCIFNKVLTGCGGTYLALTDPEPYIIAVPTRSLVKDKVLSPHSY